ncbi:MAG: group II intron reverse transcriptase domain-containing protein [Lachnospiraceae bacterium]|nr:group II intron reverse transcriptase domain-containing protein [Lachnospiraceae bacterium]
MLIIDKINCKEAWEKFFDYRINNHSFTKEEEKEIRSFIDETRYADYYKCIIEEQFPTDYPSKLIVNKEGTKKKRVVYSFKKEDNIILKFIAYNLYEFDEKFSRNCYAFRRGYGAKDAIRRFRGNKSFANKYCYKADISNYFNSIDVDILLEKMCFIAEQDALLFKLFECMLKENKVYFGKKCIEEKQGAMAGTPCSPFFANVYLSDIDKYFESKGIDYFRYSDDVLIFADTKEELNELIKVFLDKIAEYKLVINEDKVTYTEPGEVFEFLGFSYNHGVIDISDNTKRKLKAKIKRKSDALRRWQRSKELTPDKAAKGFINAMNSKFFGGRDKELDMDDFTWCRWFFPNITTDKSLKEIDEYMQQYIRYIITGRHYKGNYRISYSQMKEWGYRSLVNEYYKFKNKF